MLRSTMAALFCLLFLAGCSSTKLAYQYADWGIVWWVGDYIPMTDAQEAQLERDIVVLRQWHCRSELPRYTAWLEELKNDVRSGEFEPSTVAYHQEKLVSFIPPLADRAKPAAIQLLSSLSNEQVAALAENMAEGQAELEQEFLSDTPEATRAARTDRTAERVERWLGPLSDDQMAIVKRWSDARGRQTEVWLEGRRNWQEALSKALADRKHKDFPARVSHLIDNNSDVRGARYQTMMADSRAAMTGLVSDLLYKAEDKQLNHLLEEAASLRDDFESLHTGACNGQRADDQDVQSS